MTFLILNGYSQDSIKIEISESYELSNIILALTQYGRTDKWDVQKVPPYYDDILKYFEPGKISWFQNRYVCFFIRPIWKIKTRLSF